MREGVGLPTYTGVEYEGGVGLLIHAGAELLSRSLNYKGGATCLLPTI